MVRDVCHAEPMPDPGRRLAVYNVKDRDAVWSDDPVPQLLRPPELGGWGWRLEIMDEVVRRPAPDSGPVNSTRRQAYYAARRASAHDDALAGLPIVDWLSGAALTEETA
jgi:hypothetical protein